jgi:crossover junction endodeoxyribonuclease RuvC
MSRFILGIDPGLDGALYLYDDAFEEPGEFFDMPTLTLERNGKKKRIVDLYALARWMDEKAATIKQAIVENPQGMPGMSSNSTHQLGENTGIVKMAVAAQFIPMKLASPSAWKKQMKLSNSKDGSRHAATALFPRHSQHWARAKDDGRAEALLLAVWGSK